MTDDLLGDEHEEPFFTPVEQRDNYNYKLGRFVLQFAEMEAFLRVGCAKAAGIAIELTGVVFGELTVKSGGMTLRRLRAANGVPEDDDLRRALQQLDRIAEARNAILHRGVDVADLEFVTKPGLPGSRRQQFQIGESALEAIWHDLIVIHAALIVTIHGDAPDTAIWEKGLRHLAQIPWQYKHEPMPERTV